MGKALTLKSKKGKNLTDKTPYRTPEVIIDTIKVGAPAFYKTPEELATRLKDYFNWCNKGEEKPTITGLTLFLGFADKASLRDYGKKDGFSPLMKKARTMVEYRYEKELMGNHCVGAIFALKNMNWSDYRKIEHTHESRSLGAVLILTEDNNDISGLTEAKVGEIIKKKIKKVKAKK